MIKILINNLTEISHCIVFSGGKKVKPEEIFSTIELAKIEIDKPTFIYSDMEIFEDDSIRAIKKKILKELSFLDNISYDELYLYYESIINPSYKEIYNNITNNGNDILYDHILKQTLFNFNYNIANTDFEAIGTKDTYNYGDLLKLKFDKNIKFNMPLGMNFLNHINYAFSGNPSDVFYGTETNTHEKKAYENASNNLLINMDNNLLLNYDVNRSTIYLVVASTMINKQSSPVQSYFIDLYYPFLKKRNINSYDDMVKNNGILMKQTKEIMKDKSFKYYDNIKLLHNIYANKKKEIAYTETGFNDMNFVIHPPFKTVMPLENIFKLIHCTEDIPLIRFNPGKRKDNIFRIYSTYVSRTGKKIPFYSKSVITTFLKQPRKHNSISFYIKSNDYTIVVDLLANSSLQVSYNSKKILNTKQLEKLLKKHLNIIVSALNTLLLQSGFSLSLFDSFESPSIEIDSLKYYIYFESQSNININKCKTMFSHIFDSIDSKNESLVYKRVENFKKMDAINTTINTIYKKTNDESLVIKTLRDNYALSEVDAAKQMNVFFESFTRINGKYVNKSIDIAEHPGFATNLRFIPFEKQSYFEIENITSLKYIEFINIYIDSLLRLIFGGEYLTGIDKDIIDGVCKEKKIEDESHVDTVIINEIEKGVKPLAFITEVEKHDDEDDSDDDGIFFGDSDDEDDEDDDSDDSDDSEDKEMGGGGADTPDKIDPSSLDGTSLMRPNIFFSRMEKKDPSLFLTKKQGNFDSYSRMCPHSDLRQPVLLTQDEKDYIDKHNPGSYKGSIEYGSDPNNKFHYICPRYWCLLTNSSITEEEMKKGKCGKVIPLKATNVPKGHYVFEFDHPKIHRNAKGKYMEHSPGFLSKDSHPNSQCIPCCFKDWTNKKKSKTKETVQDERIRQCTAPVADTNITKPKEKVKQNITSLQYIIGFESYPLPDGRYGFLHPGIEKMLNIGYKKIVEPQNPAFIKKNKWTTLRFGCEISENKSFMGCVAELHRISNKVGYKWDIQELCNQLSKAIKLDDFIRYNNGTLISSFKDEKKKIREVNLGNYADTKLYKSMNKMDEVQLNFLEDAIIALENFKRFLKDPKSHIDHTFMWDILCDEQNPLGIEPINLVILEMDFNDITNNVNVLCPTNAYSNHVYDETRKNFVLIKQDGFYEILSQIIFVSKESSSVKGYHLFDPAEEELKEINIMMKTINQNMKSQCRGLASMPKKYVFDNNHDAKTIIKYLLEASYIVERQVINYQGKVIGLTVKSNDHEPSGFFVPTAPSMLNKKMEFVTMDHDIWNDFKFTISKLKDLHTVSNGKVMCLPKHKVVEDGLIVGLITQTNQFIQIVPPYQNIDEEYKLKLETLNETNHILADRKLNTSSSGDNARVTTVRNLKLENNFYNAFRNIVRVLIHKNVNNEVLQNIKHYVENPKFYYKTKMEQIIKMMGFIIVKFVDFVEYDESTLNDVEQITTCFDNDTTKKYCIMRKDVPVLLIPSKNLISGVENKQLYLERISDEFIRNKTMQSYLLESESHIQIYANNYSIDKNEFIILQQLLADNYFDNITAISKNSVSQLNNFDLAQPNSTQFYSNKIVHKPDENSHILDKYISCVHAVSKIPLNPTNGKWNTVTSFSSREILFKHTTDYCSFALLQVLYGLHTQKYISIVEIKNKLWNNFYFMNIGKFHDKIYDILNKQGKSDIIKKINSGKLSLNAAIKEDGYFISDLDVWAFIFTEHIPVIMISEYNFQSMMKHTNWLINNNTLDKKHYIIRTDKNYEYSMIETPQFLQDLSGFDDKMKTISDEKSDEIIFNNIRPDDYLEIYK